MLAKSLHSQSASKVPALRSLLRDFFLSQSLATFDVEDLVRLPRPILQRLKGRGSHAAVKGRRMAVEQPICPVCCKVKLSRTLFVSSHEFQQDKQCVCDAPKTPPVRYLNASQAATRAKMRMKKGKSVPGFSKTPSEKHCGERNSSPTIVRLAPLRTSGKRAASLLRASLLDLQLPKPPAEDLPQSQTFEETAAAVTAEISLPVEDQEPKVTEWKFAVFPGNNGRVVQKVMKRRKGWKQAKLSEIDTQFAWHPTSRTVRFDRLVPYQSLQLVNHFENHSELTSKLSLLRNLQQFCAYRKLDYASFLPLTFPLEFDTKEFHAQYAAFVCFFRALEDGNKERVGKVAETHSAGGNVWLLKPSSYNRGIGIRVFSSLDAFKSIVDECHEAFKSPTEGSKAPSQRLVVQKYIERPMLINGRKFDIRVWVLLTAEMHGYVYREGYLRTSSEPFTLDQSQLRSNFVHLTNNAVQRFSPLYSKFEPGNQLSFPQFQAYLSQSNSDFSVQQHLLPRIKSLVRLSLAAVRTTQVYKKLNPLKRRVCFELFGYDFILDELLGLWLIEVNTNPCLELSSPLLAQLIPSMLDDLLKLTVDKSFPTEFRKELKLPHVVDLPPRNNWESVGALHMRNNSEGCSSRQLLNALHRSNAGESAMAYYRHAPRRYPTASIRHIPKISNPITIDRDSFAFQRQDGLNYLCFTLVATCPATVTVSLLRAPTDKDREVISVPADCHDLIVSRCGLRDEDLAGCAAMDTVTIAVEARAKEDTEVVQVSGLLVEAREGTFAPKLVQQRVRVKGTEYLTHEIFGTGKRKPESEECVVCLSQRCDTVVLPCRHMCLCGSCAEVFRRQTACKCPMCRSRNCHTAIESLIEVPKDL